MLLELPSQVDFRAVLAHRPIIHQEEMGMQTVENVQFAERVQQRLIRSNNLWRGQERKDKDLCSCTKQASSEITKEIAVVLRLCQ